MRKLYVSALLLLTGLYAVQAQNLLTYENIVAKHTIDVQHNATVDAYALLTDHTKDGQPNDASNVNAYWIIGGNTIAADQTICFNTTPAALTGSLPTGGIGVFTYQWQLSSTSATAGFANIAGATAQGYTPGALTANRWYRRIVTSGIEKDTSAVLQITVTPVINGAFNVISAAQTICSGTAPALLTGTAPAGGNGVYAYQWQSSPDNATWTNITSATTDTYAPPVLTATAYYRRIVYSGNCSHTSTSIKVTVTIPLASNSFTQEQSVCSGQTPLAFTGSTPTGGTGAYTYLWQSSTTSASIGFATAAGTSNGKNYAPAALTQTTWFRRVATSGGCADSSAATVITVFNTAPGNPTVFGNGAWNVYAYSDNNFTTYAGFYTEPSLSFLTTDRYTTAQSPSYATGYQGCMVPVTNFSASMKRTNFTAGVYQLDLTALDDNVFVLVNGVQVYTKTCCVVPPAVTNNIWTGTLGAGDQVEIKWVQITSTSRLGVNFTVVTPTPLVAGAISNSQSVCYGEAPASGFTNTSAASGGCTYTGYQWQNSVDSVTWINISGATALTYTETAALTQTQWYRRVISDACYNSIATLPVKITVNVIPPGDTSLYGDNTWNVYEYQYLPANSNFSAATYKGYYTEPSLSFNSTSRWANGASPSLASGYQGCYVAPSYHWMSYKRTDFSPATYQIDIPAHDDNVYVYLNGLLIFSHAGCCDAHTNIWTGPLGATDQIEMRVMQGGGGAYGAITLTPVTPLPLTAGSITPSQTICAGNVPPNPLIQATAPTNGCTIKNYGWELSTDNGSSWTTVSGATASSYTIPGSIYTQTLYRRIVYDVCGNSAASVPDTIYMNATAPGDPTVFGNNVWNVYCFQDVNYSLYSGYYTEPSLTFATTSRYPSTSPPSVASGYLGCQLINNYYSVSMKRTGFTAGLYQIDVTADDDYASIYINGTLVSSLTYPTIQNNVWTGNLSSTDQIEVRWRNNAGPGQCGVRFTIVTPPPLDPGTISANNPSVCAADVPIISSVTAATGACYVNYSWQYSTDGGTTWSTVAGATGVSYTASTALTVNTQFRRVATDVCGAIAYTPAVSFTVGAVAPGDPTVFGNGAWNVYAYNANGTPFTSAIYMGYYTEPLLSFSSLNRWPSVGAPSQASGYLGCQVDPDNHWVSYRRTNFTPGTYQLDITSHDDPVYVYINGVLVFTHATCCDTHTNIWTGNLGASDKVEFLWREFNGGSNGGMNFTLVTPPTSVTGGTISASQTICNNTIPAAFANVDSAASSCYVYYQWQYQTNCTGGWTDITGATGVAYTVPSALTANTCYRRTATNACGVTAYSNIITVNIYSTTLTAGTIATNQTICKSVTAATLTSTGLPTGGDGNYVYQWQSSADNIGWTNIAGATSLTYAPGALTTTTYFRRNVTACGATAAASSASVLITVNQPPVITVQPANAVACTGANTSITVTATGTSLTYQWQVNTGSSWVNVTNAGVYTGATNATLNISGVTAGMNGYTYRVLVGGSCTPSLTSNIVTLTTGTAPSISSQPVNTTTCVGSNAMFSVTASGSGLTYQWQQRPGSGGYSNISDGGIYSGTATSTLTLTGVAAVNNNYSYQCIVTSSCAGTVTTNVAVLTVVAAITNNITADQSVCTGMTATTLTGNNSGAYTYLWQSSTVSASAGFVTASGTNNAYNYNPNPISTTTWYRRLVTNTGCNALSNVVNIVINSTPLNITASPAAQTICAGDNANFTVTASGPGTLTYQWYEYVGGVWTAITNGGIYSGATNATLTLTGATAAMNNYRYYAKVFASGCSVNSVNSNNALLTTNSAPVITTNPADVTSCAGNNVAISVAATGLGLTYQWQQNTGSGWSNLANYGIYADVNTNILRLYGVTTTINGSQYRCVVTGTCAPYTVTSGASTLTINPAVANNSISNSQNLCAGTPVPFTGSTPTGGDGTFTYQWMQNTGSGWTNIAGATSINYASGPLTQTTQFIRTVSSGSACASNNSIAITVTINPATTTTDPKDTTVCAGNTVTFSVTGTGTGLGYQWQAKLPSGSFANISNGVQYTGVNTATLSVITPAYALNGYQYRCIVSGNCSPPALTSNAATLTLNPIAIISAQPVNVNSCEGSTVSFSVTATGPGLVYQWREKIGSGSFNNITDGGVYSGTTTSTLTLTGISTAMNTNQYMCVITAGTCPVNSANASLTVNQQPSLVITNPATVCAPATVNITAAAVTTGSNLAGGTLTYWTNATATTALSNPSAVSVSGTYYIRVATSPVCYDIKPVTVTINPSLSNNNISSAQTICTATAPAAFTGSLPTGGNGVYIYQWQSSPDNATWSDISGATSTGYAAGVLTSSTWYRRVVNSNVCSGISASIKVTVDPMPVATISYSGSPYCATGTAIVTQTGQAGGTYSSTTGLSINASTGAINLAGSTPGSYTVTYNFSAGACSNTTNTSVTINALPTVIITDPAAVCAPATVNITAAAITAGSSSGLTYTYFTDAAATTVLTNPTAVATSGTYYIKGTAATSCFVIKPVTVTINPLPTATINYAGTPFCATGTASVTQTGQAGGTYSSTTGLIINASTGAINLATSTAGTYTVTYTFSNGTCGNTTTTSVAINALPTVTITNPAAVCSPATVDITAAAITAGSTSGLTYTYFTDAAATTVLTNPNAVAASGTYYIKGAAATGCFTIKPVVVTINPLPTATINYTGTPFCATGTATVTQTGQAGGTYSSTTGLIINSSTGAINLATSTAGTYTVTYSFSNGTCSNTTTTSVTINALPTVIITNPAAVCSPATVDITAAAVTAGSTSGLAYTYFTDAAATTVLTNPTAVATSGTYYIKGTAATSCFVIKPVTVTINPLPTATIGYTGTPFCATSSASVTQTGQAGGTYSSTTGLIINAGTGAINLATSTAGTYTVTYSFTNGTCSNTTTTSVTINALPTVTITNPAAVCSPATVDITAAAVTAGSTSGLTYTYFTDAAATTVLTNPNAVATSGTYYIKGAAATGCFTIKPVTVTINPLPTATISYAGTPFCATGTATVTQTGQAGGTYSSTTGLIINAGTGAINLATSTAGTYTVTYSFSNGTCSNTTTSSVTINALPTVTITNPAAVCSPATVDITTAAVTAGSTSGSTYTYFTDAAATTVLTNPTAVATSGTYYIKGTTAAGCFTIKPVTVTINPLPTLTITNPSAVCAPATVNITVAAVTAGSTGGLTFTYFTDAAATTVLTTPTAVATSGTYYIKGTAATGCFTIKPVVVTINLLPTATINYTGTPFCATGTATVTQTGQAGGTYSSTTGLIINSSTGAINLATSTAGTYTVTYSFSNGTCSNTTTTTVTINALPTVIITNPAAVCSPATVDITTAAVTAGSTSGLVYTYFTDAAATTVLTNPTAVATSGTYYIKGTAATSCFVIKPVTVTINPLPTATIAYTGTPFCATGTASVTQTGQAGGTYSSTTGLIINAGTGVINLATSTAGTYTVTYSFTNGTCSNTTTTSVTINALPTVTITNPAAVCSPATVDITTAAVTAGSTSGLTYTYFTDAAATTVLTNPTAVATSGTYYIKGTTATSCFVIKPVTVTINPLPTATIGYAGTPFCATGTASVTQTGQAGGTYSSTTGLIINAGTGAINLATSTAGTYTVSYNFTNGTCSNTTTTSVTINTLPIVVITNPAAVCAPATVNITAAAITAGSSSGLTYTYFTDAAATTVLTNPTAVATSGTYYIKGTAATSCFVIKPVTVTINPLPTATIAYTGTPYCATGTASVTQTGQAGGTYSSTTGLIINAGTGAITLATSTAGTYTVTYTFSNGTCGNATTTSVTINALPTVTITNPAAVCSPATVDITTAAVTVGSTSGLTYSYFTDAAATTVLTNPTAVATSGTYYIKGTAATSCFVIKPVTVTINPLPTATIGYAGTPFCATGTASVTQTGQAGGTYSSTTGLIINAGTGDINLATSTAGTYTVTYTFSNGTCGNTTTTSVTINALPTLVITNPAAVCSPATVDITAAAITAGSTSGLTYTYFTDAAATIVLTNPTAAATSGTYYIKGTAATSCFVIKPVIVTINPLPTATISYAGTPFCATVTASVTQTGQAGGTYSSTTGLIINAGTGAINLATSTAGTYTVTYSFTNGTCINTTTTSVTINALPTLVITNPAAVCSPATVDITTAAVTAGSTSGLTYTYFTDAATTTVLSNPNALATSGTYYIKGTAATSCFVIKPVIVTINPLPTATISYAGTPFCATVTASVTQTGQAGGTYSSTTGLIINAGTGAINLATSTAGTYTVTYSFTNGTCSNTTTTSVTINALPIVVITNPAAVCSPATVDITAAAITAGSTSGLTYTYFTDAAATIVLTNPTAVATSGTYYIKGTAATGCLTIQPVTVTINPLPTVIITNPAAVCSPATVDITAAAITAGSTSGLVYTYFTDAAATTVLINPNAVTASGIYYIMGTAATGCFTIKPVTVTINLLPTATISYTGTPFCATGTASVTQTGQAGGTYSSTTGLIFNASTGDINLATSTAGTYTVTYTFSNGTCGNTTTTSVTINALPTVVITNPAAVCSPATVDITTAAITAGSTSGLVYTYFTDAAATTALTNPTAIAISGTYYIKGTAATSCFVIKPVTVTINPLPTATISYTGTPFCATGTASVTQTGQAGGTYSSTTGLIFNASTGDINLATSTAGTYTVTYTFSNGTCGNTTTTSVTINALPTVVITNPAAVCSPATVDITAAAITAGSTSGLTYTYFTDAAATTVLTTPTAVATSGTYYITGTTAAGCEDIQAVTVTINPKPTVVITNPPAVCSPSTIDITAPATTTGSTAGLTYTYFTDATATTVLLNPNAIATGGTYYIKGTTAAGCEDIQAVTVTINPKPTVVITNPVAVCAPATVDITAAAITAGGTSGLTYTYFTDAAATTALTNPTAIAISGTYYIKGTSAAGCEDIQAVTVTINPKPTVVITNPAATCAPGTIDITLPAITTGSTAGLTHTYYTDAAATTSLSNPNAIAASGTYYIKGTTAAGCEDIKPVVVTISPKPTVAVTNPAAMCAPGTVDITAAAVTSGSTTGLTYTYFADAGTTTTLLNPNAITASGTYYIKGTTSAGCYDVQPVTVTINAKPVLLITNPPVIVCSPVAVTVDLTAAAVTAGSTPGLIYSYYTDAAGTNTLPNPNAVMTSGTYYIMGTNTTTGCVTVIKSVSVTIDTRPSIMAAASAPSICKGSTVTLSALSPGNTIKWIGLGAGNSFTVAPTASTVYTAIATAPGGCTNTTTVNVDVIDFSLSLTANINPVLAGTKTTLTTSGNYSYNILSWSPAVFFTNQTANSQTIMVKDTSKSFTVIGQSADGCMDTATLKIMVDPNLKDFFIPNAFTPNGDGKNDVFRVYGSSIKELHMLIFNTWGQKIFESSDLEKGWDGMFNNHLQQLGAYIYVVKATFYNGTVYTKKGTFNLIR